MKAIQLLILMLIATSSALAQSVVKGIILDEKGRPLELANVVVLSLPDSAFVKGATSDRLGRFVLEGIPKESVLVISYVGYETLHTPREDNLEVRLKPKEATALKGLTVTASAIVHNPNGYRYSLQNSKLSQGIQTLQLLEMLPHISVKDKKVFVFDRAVITVYIDGLKSDLKALASVPADQISSVKVDYTSAIQEGATNSGSSIRIKLKKLSDGGWANNLSASVGYALDYGWQNAGVDNTLLVRRGNLSLSYNLSVELGRLRADSYYETLYKSSSTSSWSRDRWHNRERQVNNRLALGWQISPKQTLSTSISHWGVFGKPKDYIETDRGANLLRSMDRTNHRLQAVANYTYDITKGRSFSLGADYLFRKQSQDYLEQLPGASAPSLWQYTHMYRVKPSLNLKVSPRSSYSLGLDLQLIRQNERTQGIAPTSVQEFTPAAFGMYSGQISPRLRVQAGVRLQYTHVSIERTDVYKYNHLGVFPSLSAMYMLDPKRRHMISAQFQRLMGNVPYSAVGAFRDYEGENSYTVGNPSIHAPTMNQLMVIVGLWGKLSLVNGLVYVQDPIYYGRYVDVANPRVSYTMPSNGSYQFMTAHGVEANISLFKWWTTKTRIGIKVQSADAGVKVRGQLSGSLTHHSTFNLSPTAGLGLTAMYEPTSKYLDREMQAVSIVRGYLYKTFMGDRLYARLDFSLFGKQRTMITDTPEVMHLYRNGTKIPYLGLTLRYKLQRGGKVKPMREAQPLQSYEITQDTK